MMMLTMTIGQLGCAHLRHNYVPQPHNTRKNIRAIYKRHNAQIYKKTQQQTLQQEP